MSTAELRDEVTQGEVTGQAQAILEPVFAALSQRTVWLGPVGRGSRMKLVADTLLAFEIEAMAEVDALASRLGVP
jgi:3-hydroxyisobutyrate dehydrogenase